MLMLNFDRKLKLEGRNIIFIHICIIWGHLDAAFFFHLLQKNILLFNSDSLLQRVRSDMNQNNVITLNKHDTAVALLATGFSSSKNTFI